MVRIKIWQDMVTFIHKKMVTFVPNLGIRPTFALVKKFNFLALPKFGIYPRDGTDKCNHFLVNKCNHFSSNLYSNHILMQFINFLLGIINITILFQLSKLRIKKSSEEWTKFPHHFLTHYLFYMYDFIYTVIINHEGTQMFPNSNIHKQSTNFVSRQSRINGWICFLETVI